MSHTPASDHPHVQEGVCACDVAVHPSGMVTTTPSVHCGLSTHRVDAARARVALRRATWGD